VPDSAAPQCWRNVLTGESVRCVVHDEQPAFILAQVLAHCPVALLVAQ
jgi:hypothetical protein